MLLQVIVVIVLGSLLCTMRCLNLFVCVMTISLQNNPLEVVLRLFPSYKWKTQGKESRCHLSKIIQLVMVEPGLLPRQFDAQGSTWSRSSILLEMLGRSLNSTQAKSYILHKDVHCSTNYKYKKLRLSKYIAVWGWCN